MVTGQRAFKGDSPASVIGAILRDEPAPITTQQPLAPASLDHLVATCLVKDPDERWQSAGDVAAELKWIAHRGGSDGAAAPARRAWPERTVWMAITAALAVVLVAGWLQRTVDTPQDVRLFLTPPPGMSFTSLTTATVPTPQFAISPDGRSIAFVASVNELRPTLWVRSLSASSAAIGAQRCAGAILVTEQPMDRLSRRPRDDETHRRRRRNGADDRERPGRSPWRYVGLE